MRRASAAASVAPLWGRNLRRTPLFIWGMVIAHLGIAVALAGMAAESAFTQRDPGRRAARARRVTVGPFSVRFDGVEPVAGPNWTAIEARLTARRGEGAAVRAGAAGAHVLRAADRRPARRRSPPCWDGQLYTVIGEADEQGRWQLRLWWKPFVTLIWLGGAMVAFGGLLALIGRRAAASAQAARPSSRRRWHEGG